MRQIRPACSGDLPAIMAVIDAAKGIMRATGNLHQWVGGYPSREVIIADIDTAAGFVVIDDNALVGYFAFLPSPEPTYAYIEGGAWLQQERPYHVIHRIASTPDSHGVFRSILDWCSAADPHLRIDTHRDNHLMQHCILAYGFRYCGIIYLQSGDERLAYERPAVF